MQLRLYRCLKDALHARTTSATWAEVIPWVLLGLHAQPREDTGLPPDEAVFVGLRVAEPEGGSGSDILSEYGSGSGSGSAPVPGHIHTYTFTKMYTHMCTYSQTYTHTETYTYQRWAFH